MQVEKLRQEANALRRAISDLEERALVVARSANPRSRVAHIRQISDMAKKCQEQMDAMLQALELDKNEEVIAQIEKSLEEQVDGQSQAASEEEKKAETGASEGNTSSSATDSTSTSDNSGNSAEVTGDKAPASTDVSATVTSDASADTQAPATSAPVGGTLAKKMAAMKTAKAGR